MLKWQPPTSQKQHPRQPHKTSLWKSSRNKSLPATARLPGHAAARHLGVKRERGHKPVMHLPQDFTLPMIHAPPTQPHLHLHCLLIRRLLPVPPARLPRFHFRPVHLDGKRVLEGQLYDAIIVTIPLLRKDLDPLELGAAELRGTAGPGPP